MRYPANNSSVKTPNYHKVPEFIFPELISFFTLLWDFAAPRWLLNYCRPSYFLVFPLRAAVGLDNVFDLPSADWTAGVGHLLEFEATGVAETHVSTGVDDRVHSVLVTDRALIRPSPMA